MTIQYNCRHCNVQIGKIEQPNIRTDQLGFQQLNNQERMDMITYKSNGDIEVKTICEDCQEALERYPEFHSLQTFIQ